MATYVSIVTQVQFELLQLLADEFAGQIAIRVRDTSAGGHAIEIDCDRIVLVDYLGFLLDKLDAVVEQLERSYRAPAATTTRLSGT